MADRDVEIDVTANDKSGPAFKSVARNAEQAEKAVKKAQTELDKFGTKKGGGGSSIGKDFGLDVLEGLKAIKGQGVVALAAVGLAASPAIAASIQAAIIGGAGIGGIIGGVAAVKDDVRIKAAGTELSKSLLGNIREEASVFINPVLEALGLVEARAEDIGDNIGSIFQSTAGSVTPLTEAVLDAAEAISGGLAVAAGASGPALREIADGIVLIGEALGEGFESLGDNSTEVALAISDVSQAIAGTIDLTFDLIDAFSEVYGGLRAFSEFITGDYAGAAEILASTQLDNIDATMKGATATKYQAEASEEAADAIRDLNDQIFQNANANISAEEASIRYAEQLRETMSASDGLAGVTDNERQALLNQAEAANRVTQSLIDTGASTDELTRVTNMNRDQLAGAAVQMGMNEQQAQEYANRLLAVPDQVTTAIRLQGVEAAKAAAADLRAYLQNIPDEVVNLAIQVTGTGASRQAVEAGIRKQYSQGFMAEGVYQAQFAAEAATWAAGTSGMRSRTGGATNVDVTSEVNVALDGRPFYDMTTKAVSSSRKREDFRRTVGSR